MIPADPALIESTPRPAPAEAPTDALALIGAQLDTLARLAEVGMEIAEACGRDAVRAAEQAEQGAAAPAGRRDPSLAFARVARAVRLTIALQSRLAKELAAPDRAEAYAEAERRRSRRAALGGLVEEAARSLVEASRKIAGQDGDEAAAAKAEIGQMAQMPYERLTDVEDEALFDLPFDEAVAAVCRDLGLSPERTADLLSAVAPPPGPPAEAAALGVEASPTGAEAAPPDPDPPPSAVAAGPDPPRAPP